MANGKNNNIFEKTSFLGANSSQFIQELYADYLTNPQNIPNEWKIFFEGLKDEKDGVIKNVNGPSWARKKKLKNNLQNNFDVNKNKNGNLDIFPEKGDVLEAAKNSVRANMLVRAFRIRGHLISNLDPLGLQKEKNTQN